ncbi:MAG: hypothetical protein Q9170_008209 [Blastenia crenularia]
MSEYWKSTPKYWCKHCKTFVRDTKLEKTNHEATPKHQGNIKRFLRDLHRGHEREERDKDRAKNEVERLNGVVSGAPFSTRGTGTQSRPIAASRGREPTPVERKAQLARLAEMGVAVPEEYRREVAMAGDWQTLAERPIWDHVKKEEDLDDFKDFKPDPSLNVGIRKRKLGDEEEAQAVTVRKGWGSATRRYPGSAGDGNDALEALLDQNSRSEQDNRLQTEGSLLPPDVTGSGDAHDSREIEAKLQSPLVKREDSETVDLQGVPIPNTPSVVAVKQEDEHAAPPVMFKKRKSKQSKSS